MTRQDSGSSIWFFIGISLLVDGILIVAAEIWEVLHPPANPVVLFNLQANVWWGAALLSLAAVGVNLYLSHGGREGWMAPAALGWIIAGFVALVALIVVDSRVSHPLVAIEHMRLRQENLEVKQALQERKKIDQAKTLLIEKDGLTENEAHQLIQKTSRDQRRPMVDVANAIVLAYPLRKK